MQSKMEKLLLNELTLFCEDRKKSKDDSKFPLIAIMGPTASGKSSLAMRISQKLPVEIISADSMQVYKGMDIGTAKPTARDQELIPHHLIDLFDISIPLNVYKYIELAEEAIDKVVQNNKIPLLVGGSGMYIRALIYGMDPLPADPILRNELDQEYGSKEGFEKLKSLMKELDSEDFLRWEKNHRKLIRSLEVFKLTGKSITQLQKTWELKPRFDLKAYKLRIERSRLREKIATRSKIMLQEGWVEETEKLIESGLLESPTARQAIGYPVIADFLSGKLTYDDMQKKISTVTAQFARRQDTWFRNKHPEANFLDVE